MARLVLIGYRGTGKTPVARKVAAAKGWTLHCMDALIAERAGCPIPEYVAAHGWPAFRDLETQVARDLAAEDACVVDTGGGVVVRPENMAALKTPGTLTIWLTATAETIRGRIEGDANRPSLTGEKSLADEVAEVLAEREPLYRRYADAAITTDDWDLPRIAAEVLALLDAAT